MAIIDKISVGGTVYDIGGSGGADNGLVTAHGNVEGFIPYVTATAAETTTLNGVTITRDGYRITLNGTDTSTEMPFLRLTGTLFAKEGSPGTSQATTGAYQLPEKNNHVYRMTCKLVSGTVTGKIPWCAGYASTGSAATSQPQSYFDDVTYRDYRNSSGNGKTGIAVRYEAGTVFANAVFEITVVDTESGLGVGDPIITVSGTSAEIVAQAGFCYVCGELTSLSFEPSVRGLCEVIFTSGTTPTALTISKAITSHTIHMPPWWTGVEASKTYDIVVRNGEWVGVSVW